MTRQLPSFFSGVSTSSGLQLNQACSQSPATPAALLGASTKQQKLEGALFADQSSQSPQKENCDNGDVNIQMAADGYPDQQAKKRRCTSTHSTTGGENLQLKDQLAVISSVVHPSALQPTHKSEPKDQVTPNPQVEPEQHLQQHTNKGESGETQQFAQQAADTLQQLNSASTEAPCPAQTAGLNVKLSLEERQKLLLDLEDERQVLETSLRTAVESYSTTSLKPASSARQKAMLFIEGQSRPLTALGESLLQELTAGFPEQEFSVVTVNTMIVDLAARKAYGQSTGGAQLHPLQDDSSHNIWVWEVRELKELPKKARDEMQAARKVRKQIQERFQAVEAACTALRAPGTGKAAEGKLTRALQKLQKVPQVAGSGATTAVTGAARTPGAATARPASAAAQAGPTPMDLDQSQLKPLSDGAPVDPLSATLQSPAAVAAPCMLSPTASAPVLQSQGDEAAHLPGSAGPNQTAQKLPRTTQKPPITHESGCKAEREAEKERLRVEREAEKERVRLEKEAEKEKVRMEKEAEKERQRLEKEAERERQKAEKEAKRAAEEAKHAGFGSKKALESSKKFFQKFVIVKPAKPERAQEDATPQDSSQPSGAAAPSPLPSSAPLPSFPDPAADRMAQLDQLWSQGWDPQQLVDMKQQWRMQRPMRKRLPGVPPTWARKPGAETRWQSEISKMFGEGCDLTKLPCWRFKLLKHHDSVRPAYYGSFSRKSATVRARRPLVEDSQLDYDVESDQDWEEEPEDAEDANSDGHGEDGEDTEKDDDEDSGFIVPDDFLSDDEGVQGDNLAIDDTDEAMEQAPELDAGAGWAPDARFAQLEAVLDRARRSGRPVVLCQFPGMKGESSCGLDPSVLACLRPIILAKDVEIHVPQDPAQVAVALAEPKQPPSGNCQPVSSTGRARSDVSEAVLADLTAFLSSCLERGIDKVVAAFMAAHPDHRVAKVRLRNKIRDIAQYNSATGRWLPKPPAPPSTANEREAATPTGTPGPAAAVQGAEEGTPVALPKPDAPAGAAAQGPTLTGTPGPEVAMQGEEESTPAALPRSLTSPPVAAKEQPTAPTPTGTPGPEVAMRGVEEATPVQSTPTAQPAAAPLAIELCSEGAAIDCTGRAANQPLLGGTSLPINAACTATSLSIAPAADAGAALPTTATVRDAAGPSTTVGSAGKRKLPAPGDSTAAAIKAVAAPAAKVAKTNSIASFFTKGTAAPKPQPPKQALPVQSSAHKVAHASPPAICIDTHMMTIDQLDGRTTATGGSAQTQQAAVLTTATLGPATTQREPVRHAEMPLSRQTSCTITALAPQAPSCPTTLNSTHPEQPITTALPSQNPSGPMAAHRPCIPQHSTGASPRVDRLLGGSRGDVMLPDDARDGHHASNVRLAAEQLQRKLSFQQCNDAKMRGDVDVDDQDIDLQAEGEQTGAAELEDSTLAWASAAPTVRSDPFWRSLRCWLMDSCVPTEAQIEQALGVFGEERLMPCVAVLPRDVITVLVRTVACDSSSVELQAACAGCLGNVVMCLSSRSQERTVPSLGASRLLQRAGPAPCSLEALMEEPTLLPALKDGLSSPHMPLAAASARLLASLCSVATPTVPEAADAPEAPAACASTAACKFKVDVASNKVLRAHLLRGFKCEDGKVSGYALMAASHLLQQPEAAGKLLGTSQIAGELLVACAECCKSDQVGISKWAMACLSALLRSERIHSLCTAGHKSNPFNRQPCITPADQQTVLTVLAVLLKRDEGTSSVAAQPLVVLELAALLPDSGLLQTRTAQEPGRRLALKTKTKPSAAATELAEAVQQLSTDDDETVAGRALEVLGKLAPLVT